MRKYWRVTFLAANGRRRHVWATGYNNTGDGNRITFFVVDKYGDESEPRELVIAAPGDIVSLRPAEFNLKYAELEVRRG